MERRYRNLARPGRILLLALAPLLLTWPLPRHLASALPLGSEASPTVPWFNLWTLGWNVNRLGQAYRDYWQAPIFYPAPDAFAFSEPQPLSGLLAAPWWGLNPGLAYNLVLLLFLLLNGLAAFVFLRHRGLAPGAALAGGLLVQALPFLAHERGVLQLQPIFGLIWALDALWLLAERPTWRHGGQLALAMGVAFATSENLALMAALVLAITAPFFLWRYRRRRAWIILLLGGGLGLALIAPLAWSQLGVLAAMDFRRSAATILRGSARLAEFLRPSPTILASRWLPWLPAGRQRLYSGLGLPALALLGLLTAGRRPEDRGWTRHLGAAAVVAVVLSFGLNLNLGGWQPYDGLRRLIPGLTNLRSPFRFAYLAQTCLALLAARGLAWPGSLARPPFARPPFPRPAIRWLLVGGLLALTLLEIWPRPARLTGAPPPLELRSLQPPVAILPFPADGSTASLAETAGWMAAGVALPQPHTVPPAMVNGYSGYFPQMQRQLRDLLADFPTPAGLEALRAVGVNTVLLRQDWPTAAQQQRLAAAVAAGELAPRTGPAGFLAYALVGSAWRPATAYDGPWALSASVSDGELRLRGRALIPDAHMYILAPGAAAPIWRVSLRGPRPAPGSAAGSENGFDAAPTTGGRATIYERSVPGALLLHHGMDERVLLRLPAPGKPGIYQIQVFAAPADRLLGEVALEVP